MLKNSLLVAVRVLVRHKGYSIINIVGLSVGISCFLLAALMVVDECSYDRFHREPDRIFRVRVDARIGDKEYHTARSAAPVAPALMATLPGVESAARIRVVGDRTIRYGDRSFSEYRFYMADSMIFRVFNFEVVEGDMRRFLTMPGTVVVTEEAARKYFGDVSALGKTLVVDGTFPVTVCGVVKSFPLQSHWHFNILCAAGTRDFGDTQDWLGNNWHTYVRLKPGASAAEAEEAFVAATREHVIPRLRAEFGIRAQDAPGAPLPYRYVFQPVTEIHLTSHLDEELEPNGNIAAIVMFGIVGVLVLLIACINIMNLNAARTAQRAKEVGIRKVLGSGRGQLVVLFLTETLILTCLAALVSLVIVELVLPLVNGMAGKQLSPAVFGVPRLVGAMALLTVTVAGLAGAVPAGILSALPP